jgi:peptidoglycan/LPS O-acetylase OafA/YrhL
MVLVGHFVGHFPTILTPSTSFVFNFAPIAVSWFFILSGFIIAYNYPSLSDNSARANFVLSRVARLWPVHAVTLFAALCVVSPKPPMWFLSHLTLTQAWSADPNVVGAYNGPSWSISNEMFFYLVYVVLLAPARWLRFAAVVAPVALALYLLVDNGCFLPGMEEVATPTCIDLKATFPPSRLIEFLAGVALFHLRPRVPQAIGLAAAGAVLLGYLPTVPGLAYTSLYAYFVWQAGVIAGGCALIASLSREGWLSRLLSGWLLVVGGEISYSIYMVHQGVNMMVLPHIKTWGMWPTFALVTGITITASVGLFYIIEAPVRDVVKAWLRARRQTNPALAPQTHNSAIGPHV